MKFIRLYFYLALFFPILASAENPCLIALNVVEVNLTNNQGCNNSDYPKNQKLCSSFLKCVGSFDICVVSNGNVFGGNSTADFTFNSASITFGVNRSLTSGQHKYCVIGGMIYDDPGEGLPYWYFRTFTPNGGWVGEEIPITNMPQGPQSLNAFNKLTKKDFNLFILRVQEIINDSNFKDGDYGYHKGEKP